MKSTTAIYDLLEDDYDHRMMHRIPVAASVVRHEFVKEACKDKVVLDIGGSGPLAELIKQSAKSYQNIDKNNADHCVDLDKTKVPIIDGIELVICGEVVEHLSNPGLFLDGLSEYKVPVIFTVPNSFTKIGTRWIKKGIENVNADHVAYYSYYTFSNLLKRHGFKIDGFSWYNGEPGTAEGLIFLAHSEG